MLSRASILLPVALIAGLVAVFLTAQPFDYLGKGAPPVESLSVEHVRLDGAGIHATVRAAGSEPMVIAQVQVDGAYRIFAQDPAGPIGYLKTARLDIPYPWIAGEAHHLVFLTSTGAGFEHSIDVAVATPGTTLDDLNRFPGIVSVFVADIRPAL